MFIFFTFSSFFNISFTLFTILFDSIIELSKLNKFLIGARKNTKIELYVINVPIVIVSLLTYITPVNIIIISIS